MLVWELMQSLKLCPALAVLVCHTWHVHPPINAYHSRDGEDAIHLNGQHKQANTAQQQQQQQQRDSTVSFVRQLS
jgi:hypothetical protein